MQREMLFDSKEEELDEFGVRNEMEELDEVEYLIESEVADEQEINEQYEKAIQKEKNQKDRDIDTYKEALQTLEDGYRRYAGQLENREYIESLLNQIEQGSVSNTAQARNALFEAHAFWLVKLIAYYISLYAQHDQLKSEKDYFLSKCFTEIQAETAPRNESVRYFFDPKKSRNYKQFCKYRCKWILIRAIAEFFSEKSHIEANTYSNYYMICKRVDELGAEQTSVEGKVRAYNQKLFEQQYYKENGVMPTQDELDCFFASDSSLYTKTVVAKKWAALKESTAEKKAESGKNKTYDSSKKDELFWEYNTAFYSRYFAEKEQNGRDVAAYLLALQFKGGLTLKRYAAAYGVIHHEELRLEEPIENADKDYRSNSETVGDIRENVSQSVEIRDIPEIQKKIFEEVSAILDGSEGREEIKQKIDFKAIAKKLNIPDEAMAFRLYYNWLYEIKK